MIVAVAKETSPGERRVALVPASVATLIKAGLEVHIEAEAGLAAGYPDEAYVKAGATVATDRLAMLSGANVVLQVALAGAAPEVDLTWIKPGQIVIAFLDPLSHPQAIQELARRGGAVLSMELMPRITRAQSMDALSSMATVAGYKAVIMAAAALGRMFPMLMTAAGTVVADRVFVIGAGVAGLQAIATARRLGAIVRGYDIRPAVKEQVESLGAKFVEMELAAAEDETKGGYAKQMDEDFYRKQRELMASVLAESDVVITTAAVPGKKAPILITADMVKAMPHGSVIVDLAAERGGNCELTQPGQTVVEHGVTILGSLNLPSAAPYHASQMYAKNIVTFLKHLLDDGQIKLDTEDEIVAETLVTQGGEVVHPRIRELLKLAPPAPAEEAPSAPATPDQPEFEERTDS